MPAGNTHYAGIACVDCLHLHENGTLPGNTDPADDPDWDHYRQAHFDAADRWTPGHFPEEAHPGQRCDEDLECTRTAFSTQRCDVCRSHLAGTREDITFWEN